MTANTNNFPQMPTFSPMVCAQSLKNSTKINSKKESKNKIFEKAALLALKFKGECQSTTYSICKGKNSIKFKCQNNHTFFMSVDFLDTLNIEGIHMKGSRATSDCWCYKCKKFFDTCKEVASTVGIVVLEGLYQNKISMMCDKKHHTFKISYTKKLHTLSCSECRREEREEWKEHLKQEEQRRNADYMRRQ
jgi:hypothetical protein